MGTKPTMLERLKRAQFDGFIRLESPTDPVRERWRQYCHGQHRPFISVLTTPEYYGERLELDLEPVYSGLKPGGIEAQLIEHPALTVGELAPDEAVRIAANLAAVFRTRRPDEGLTPPDPPGHVVYDGSNESAILVHLIRRRATGQTFVAISGNVVVVDVGVGTDQPFAVFKAKSPEAALHWAQQFWPAEKV